MKAFRKKQKDEAQLAMAKRGRAERKKEKSSKWMKRQKIGSGVYLAPSLIGVLLFYILPFFVVIFYSVVDNPISRQFVGLENFTKVAKNVAFQTAVKNTATFSVSGGAFPDTCHGAGSEAAVPFPVPYLFLKPHDGAGCLHRFNLAGTVPLQRCGQ